MAGFLKSSIHPPARRGQLLQGAVAMRSRGGCHTAALVHAWQLRGGCHAEHADLFPASTYDMREDGQEQLEPWVCQVTE